MTDQETILPAAVQPLASVADQTRAVGPARKPKKLIYDAFGRPERAVKHEALIGKLMKREAIKNAPRLKSTGVKERRKLVLSLLSTWQRVHDITDILGITLPTASKDLGELCRDGKAEMRRDGNHFYYRAVGEAG